MVFPLFEILEYGFMQRALLTGAVIAVLCSVVGMFLVLKRYSLFGDALAHSAFGGVAVGLFVGIYPIWAAYVFAIVNALLITRAKQKFDISGDALIAIMLSTGIATALVIIGLSGGFSIDIFSFLFGSILLIGVNDTITALAIASGILLVILFLFKQIIYTTFDEKQAKVSGIHVERINYLIIFMAGITVVTAIQLIGVLLISALFVMPNVTAMLMGRGFKDTMIISIITSVSCVITGIMLSYVLNIAPAGSIVLIAISTLIVTMIAKSKGAFSKSQEKIV